MYIEERGDKYKYVEWYTDYRTGIRHRVSVVLDKNTAAYRREAEKILSEKIKRKMDAPETADITLSDAVEMYLAWQKQTVKDSTTRRNAYALHKVASILGGDVKVNRLDAGYIRRSFVSSGASKTNLNELLRRFKAFMRWCYKSDLVADISYLDKLEKFKIDTPQKIKYLEGDELRRLIPELKVDINRFVISFLALSGLRIGEAAALLKSDVDTDARIIHVTKTYDVVNKVSTSTKTESSSRDVYMQDELLKLVAEINAYYDCTCAESELFFHDYEGGHLHYYAVEKYFKENCLRVLGRPMTLHSLRHTHASLLFEQGVSLEAVSLRLGHSDSRITREIYLHITLKKKDEYNAQIKEIALL